MTESTKPKPASEIKAELLDSLPADRRPYIVAAHFLNISSVDYAMGYDIKSNANGVRLALHSIADAIEEDVLIPPLPNSLADIITEMSSTVRAWTEREQPPNARMEEKWEADYIRRNYQDVAELAVRAAIDFGTTSQHWV